jgi:Cys-rich protein (TIGR01571 family)
VELAGGDKVIMAYVNERFSLLNAASAVGTLMGLLLLGYAGMAVVTSSEAGTAASPRNLVMIGFITTTRYPSSFDSSDSSSISASVSEPSKSFESQSLRSSDAPHIFRYLLSSTGSLWLLTSVTLALQFCFAFLYWQLVVKPVLDQDATLVEKPAIDKGGAPDFDTNICKINENPWVCLQGFCCPMVRAAHNNAVAGICGFWESIICWCCCSWLTLGLGPCCLVVYWRQMLKSIMNIGDNVVTDFCVTMICPCMSIVQQALAVDNELGYRVTGCCEWTPQQGMSGVDDYMRAGAYGGQGGGGAYTGVGDFTSQTPYELPKYGGSPAYGGAAGAH